MKTKLRALFAVLFFGCLVVARQAAAQGGLTPPGAPGPLFKTLDQVQPRTPISVLPYTINAGGSYYLADNLAGLAGQNGVTINANDVTLDLNGFSLTGTAGSINGIAVSSSCRNLSIYNGGVSAWGASGISASNATASRFENVHLLNNALEGITLGSNSFAFRCFAYNNGGSGLRVVGSGSRIEDNQANANGGWGFRVDAAGNLIVKNSAVANTGTNYHIAAGNSYGQIILLPAGAFTNATPWANFYSPVCTPTTCAAQGATCGTISDGCGGTLNCGTCPAGQTCGGGGVANVCGACVPKTCAQQGFNCGAATDGCGNIINCGACLSPQTCGGGGVANACGPGTCVPKTCAQLGVSCGPAPDGCGNIIQCGSCPAGHTCVTGVCQ